MITQEENKIRARLDGDALGMLLRYWVHAILLETLLYVRHDAGQ